jgi:hypothetical protein
MNIEFKNWIKPKIKKSDIIIDIGFDGIHDFKELDALSELARIVIGFEDVIDWDNYNYWNKPRNVAIYEGDYLKLLESANPKVANIIVASYNLCSYEGDAVFKYAARVLKDEGKFLINDSSASVKYYSKYFTLVNKDVEKEFFELVKK